MLLRGTVAALSTGLVAALVYQPHTLRGETPARSFPPQRIVSFNLAADEMLVALAPLNRIAALTSLADDPRYSNVTAQARRVAHKVGSNAEQVMAMQPDLIITAPYTSVTAKALLYETGIPMLELHPYESFATVQQNILTVGQAVGANEHAQMLVTHMKQRLQELQQRIGDASRPRVLYYAPDGFTAGSGTSIHDMIIHAGGRNMAVEVGIHGFKKISRELLVALSPAVIIVSGEQEQKGLREALLADPTLQEIAAVRTQRVYAIPEPYLSTLSHHMVKGVEAMARVLHSDVFASIGGHE